ncbi:hypothetical protein [Chondromyces apiculatus]|uniref:Lipoprotein n=1 Tax=Chondromyces apiculatus DSM 436 TaxID=1192034 RepID=A0A017T876_9BACT|nr:hypothetical protein [Chondromyces apiculatus]EYF05162.1 Hypothetical protein CAP_3527 [Chondromyces apiculatus DSM 436]
MKNLGVLWAASLSYALAGCTVAVSDEGEGDPTLDEGAGAESEGAASEEGAGVESEGAASEDVTAEAPSAIQSEPAAVVRCGGNQHYCLAQCSKTDEHWHVVDHVSNLNTSCSVAGEA